MHAGGPPLQHPDTLFQPLLPEEGAWYGGGPHVRAGRADGPRQPALRLRPALQRVVGRSPYGAAMPTIVTAEAIAARDDLADWRYLLGRLETTYRCGTFGAAGALAAAIADAADAAGHHPDLDLRYPDVVHVALTTHAAAAETTDLDVALAGTISGLAAAARRQRRTPPAPRATRSPSTPSTSTPCARSGRPCSATGPCSTARTGRSTSSIRCASGRRSGSSRWTSHGPQRNRIHVDVTVAHDVAEAAGRRRARRRRPPRQRRARPVVVGPRRRRGQRGLRLHLAGPLALTA